MPAALHNGEIYLSGDVGTWMYDDGFTMFDVITVLGQVKASKRLVVHINSGGGDATEGAAIYSLLSGRSEKVEVVIDGIAASAASLIAMAGDTVTMSTGSVMMIHDPSGVTIGTSEEHSKTIEGLEALGEAYASVYASKSGKTQEQCREIMKRETWFTAEEAVKEGFADVEKKQKTASAFAAFDYRKYARAPEQLVALAMANKRPSPPNPKKKQENEMSSQKSAGAEAHAAATARIKAIMKAEAADGRRELAEHLAYDTEMTVEQAVAVMTAAPKVTDAVASLENRRLNGEGLNMYGASLGISSMRDGRESRLVTSMKQRHSAK